MPQFVQFTYGKGEPQTAYLDLEKVCSVFVSKAEGGWASSVAVHFVTGVALTFHAGQGAEEFLAVFQAYLASLDRPTAPPPS